MTGPMLSQHADPRPLAVVLHVLHDESIHSTAGDVPELGVETGIYCIKAITHTSGSKWP